MNCSELVELVTAYLDGALDGRTAASFAAHLDECRLCRIWVEQFRQTTRLLARAPRPATLPPGRRSALLTAFREAQL